MDTFDRLQYSYVALIFRRPHVDVLLLMLQAIIIVEKVVDAAIVPLCFNRCVSCKSKSVLKTTIVLLRDDLLERKLGLSKPFQLLDFHSQFT